MEKKIWQDIWDKAFQGVITLEEITFSYIVCVCVCVCVCGHIHIGMGPCMNKDRPVFLLYLTDLLFIFLPPESYH